jgi:branched-chain amino acid transport system permease protein
LVQTYFPNQTTLFLGVVFLVIVYFLPHGVVGRLEQILEQVRKRR